MAISVSEFTNIMQNGFDLNVNSLASGLFCPVCGKPIRLSKNYYVNGVKRKYSGKRMICTNMNNSHRWKVQDFLTNHCDMWHGAFLAHEGNCIFSNRIIN